MSINYAILDLAADVQDINAWANQNIPHLLASGLLNLGTEEDVVLLNAQTENANLADSIDLEMCLVNNLEEIFKAISTYEVNKSGQLKKYNVSKKAFIVDVKHGIGEYFEDGNLLESLTILTCTLNDNNDFVVDLQSLNTTVVSSYNGEDEWGEPNWLKVTDHSILEEFVEAVTSLELHKDRDVDAFVVRFIDEQFKKMIQDNLDKVTKLAESVALVK